MAFPFPSPRSICLAALWIGATLTLPPASGAEAPLLKVAFGNQTIILEGRVDSEATAEALISAIRTARPELATDRSRLVVDASASLPSVSDLRSVLSEIALSTHEGRLELWPDRLVISGLTDSLVTQSALRIRAAPLLAGRILQNHVCVVGDGYLPEIAVSLTNGVAMPAEPTGIASLAVQTRFEPPGVRLEKLLETIRFVADFGRLAHLPPPASSAAPLLAHPLPHAAMPPGVATPPGTPTNGSPPADTPPLTATPVETVESLPSVFFSRNSFLLQANQVPILDSLAKHLLSPDRRGAPVRIEAVKPSGGSPAFHEYLCERRLTEVTRFLGERGVAVAGISVKTVDSSSPIDGGEVRVSVEVPPPPPAPVAPVAPVAAPAPATSQ